MRRIELFVYDFDGTLVDSGRDIADAVNLALAEMGLRGLPRESILGYVGHGMGPLLAGAVAAARGDASAPPAEIADAIELFKKYYDRCLLEHTVFYPRCRETLDFFRHKKQAVFSNKPAPFIRKILAGLGGLGTFAMTYGGGDVKKKPDPDGLLRLMSELSVPPGETLMVGDSPIDIETGKRAGVATCAVTYGLTPRAALAAAGPDWLIDDFGCLMELFC